MLSLAAAGLSATPRVIEAGETIVARADAETRVLPGEEFTVMRPRILPGGELVLEERGLLLVRAVADGTIVLEERYASPRTRAGDELHPVPRRGADLTGYFEVLTDGIRLTNVVGFEMTLRPGFPVWRPYAAVEVPIVGGSLSVLRTSLVGGVQWNGFFGRVRLTPSAGVGFSSAVRIAEDPSVPPVSLSHAGAVVRVRGSLLLTRDLEAFVQTGIAYWHGFLGAGRPFGSPLGTDAGFIVGFGVTLK